MKSAYNLCIENGYCPNDHVAHLFSYAHGITTLVIFGALLHGTTIYAQAARLHPQALYAWLQSNQITQLSLSVGLVRALGELADSHPPLTNIRMLSTGGETINRSAIQCM